MRIHVLPVPHEAQPQRQPFRYPEHNADYGIEQDFLRWLQSRPDILADARGADFHYLPIFWTRWHLGHDYGRRGLDELQRIVDHAIRDEARTFTVCQFAGGPIVRLGATRQYVGSGGVDGGIPVPLLSSPHRRPRWTVRKRFLASFLGRLRTHQLREQMAQLLHGRKGYYIRDRAAGWRTFVWRTLQSRVVLAPRGTGASSFRFYEAMQLGVVPLMLSDVDSRPFSDLIDWPSASLFASSASQIPTLIESRTVSELDDMGRAARSLWSERLRYGRWCELVLADLGRAY